MKQPLFRQQALDFKKTSLWGGDTRGSFAVFRSDRVGGRQRRAADRFRLLGRIYPQIPCQRLFGAEHGFDQGLPAASRHLDRKTRQGRPNRKAGDTLFVLSTDSSSRDTPQAQAAAIEQLKQRRESLEAELGQQEHIDRIQYRALLDRLHGMQRELQQVNSEIATQQQRLAGAEATLQRYQQLLPTKFVSAVQAQQNRTNGWTTKPNCKPCNGCK